MSDVPWLASLTPPPGLLSPAEAARFAGFKVPKRQRDWLLGRWTAKRLVQAHLAETDDRQLPLDKIEILAREDGAPYVQAGERLPFSLSISHSGVESFCALCDVGFGAVGVDVEMIEPRPPALAQQFFAAEELAAILAHPSNERDFLITLVWSAKEAFLKCIREGLRVDTRALTVVTPSETGCAGWRPLVVRPRSDLLSPTATYLSWWQREAGAVLTLGLLTP